MIPPCGHTGLQNEPWSVAPSPLSSAIKVKPSGLASAHCGPLKANIAD